MPLEALYRSRGLLSYVIRATLNSHLWSFFRNHIISNVLRTCFLDVDGYEDMDGATPLLRDLSQ